MKKKKGKKITLYIRKKRNISTNKRTKYVNTDFKKVFNFFFLNRRFLLKRNSFAHFLKKFRYSPINKVSNYMKNFGLEKNYKMNNYKYKSYKSIKLILKFEKKKKLLIFDNLRSDKIFTEVYFDKFQDFVNYKEERAGIILFKKKLYLHISYRHLMLLPVRGQRTKTNAKTRKDFGIF